MARLILIITAVLTLGSIVLGFMNRAKFIEARTEKDSLNADTKALIADANELTEDTKKVHDDSNTIEDEKDIANEGVKETNNKIEQVAQQIKIRQDSITKAENEITAMRQQLAPFDGITIENLNQKLEDMKLGIADKEVEISELEKVIEVSQGKVAQNRDAIRGYSDAQSKRNASITLNGSEATITAVNGDWGFVVVNAGKNKGVPTDARLMIKRGTEHIGQLRIVSIEPSMLVANIVQDSLKRGVTVIPGDRVVFETGVN
ncbi:MAG: hypothetical protein P8J87_02980 [Verrucomicrobiales bacterium]|nr:hypothetical protein [Verrucomicrobiales bacterium]